MYCKEELHIILHSHSCFFNGKVVNTDVLKIILGYRVKSLTATPKFTFCGGSLLKWVRKTTTLEVPLILWDLLRKQGYDCFGRPPSQVIGFTLTVIKIRNEGGNLSEKDSPQYSSLQPSGRALLQDLQDEGPLLYCSTSTGGSRRSLSYSFRKGIKPL